ncbi:MAG: type II toxin-antitoxin system RelE/ParE family toxin [Oscillospiraceae bacterium]|nr:type II toxin-antitoxin system RelE/ParE family toxin [Oscillospiraceae bacterium]
MYKVITYKDRSGNDEVADYIQELNGKMKANKDARIKYSKIIRYIDRLRTYGVAIGEPTIKHIEGTDLWELRPTNDRIFFAYWKDNIFVLLSHFVKKSQKTPLKEIERAKRNMKDFVERHGA